MQKYQSNKKIFEDTPQIIPAKTASPKQIILKSGVIIKIDWTKVKGTGVHYPDENDPIYWD